jgi:hypothetical protein
MGIHVRHHRRGLFWEIHRVCGGGVVLEVFKEGEYGYWDVDEL